MVIKSMNYREELRTKFTCREDRVGQGSGSDIHRGVQAVTIYLRDYRSIYPAS
jgi:hypothetical protein